MRFRKLLCRKGVYKRLYIVGMYKFLADVNILTRQQHSNLGSIGSLGYSFAAIRLTADVTMTVVNIRPCMVLC